MRRFQRMFFMVFLLLAGWASVAESTYAQDDFLPGDPGMDTSIIESFTADAGRFTFTLRKTSFNGQPIFSLNVVIPSSQGVMIDHIGLDAKTMELVYRQTPYFAFGPHFIVAFVTDHTKLSGTLTPFDGSEAIIINETFDTPVFDEFSLGWVISTLPLQEGASVKLPAMTPIAGESPSFEARGSLATVTGREIIEGDEGKSYDCWVVEVDYNHKPEDPSKDATYWVTKEAPYLVKWVRHRGSKSTTLFKKVRMLD